MGRVMKVVPAEAGNLGHGAGNADSSSAATSAKEGRTMAVPPAEPWCVPFLGFEKSLHFGSAPGSHQSRVSDVKSKSSRFPKSFKPPKSSRRFQRALSTKASATRTDRTRAELVARHGLTDSAVSLHSRCPPCRIIPLPEIRSG